MVHQVGITVRTPVTPGHQEALNDLLVSMGVGNPRYGLIPFDALPATHFARLMILDDGVPSLLLMLDCDAPAEQRLEEFVRVAGTGMDEVFSHCEGYPVQGELSSQDRIQYLRSRLTDVEVYYVHTVGRTLEQIKQEEQLRRAIEDFLDRAGTDFSRTDPTAIREAIRTFVNHEPALAWARTPPPPLEFSFRVREAIHKCGLPLILLYGVAAILPAALIWIVALRFHELTDPHPSITLDPDRLRTLSDQEDFIAQNAISTLAPIKPGRFWDLTARLFLGIANYSSRHIFNRGSLSGLTTVHFARFKRVGNGRHVLFTSYYDGSLESYMNDFIDQVGWVLNSVFGNEVGYPRTRWLFLEGAANEEGFKAFLRGHQIPTQVWYSAYPGLAAVNIDNNAQIRAGLYGTMNAEQAAEWLRLL